jgi:UDP-N-acetylglucosamine acyltransferase
MIDPLARVEPGARLGEGVQIGPFCVVGAGVSLGARTRLISHVSIVGNVTVGEDCVIYPFATLGHPPQDFKHRGEDTRLIIGARNVIREHMTMHPGTAVGRGETRVGEDGYFMVGAHIAHDCIVGDRVVMANCASIGGYVQIADGVMLGGLSGVHQHVRVGRGAFVAQGAALTSDLIPFGLAQGNPAALAGLNLVGLKRRGFPRETIHTLRAAYRMLVAEEGTFQERLVDVAESFRDTPEVQEIVAYIRADGDRALCLPGPG